MSSDLSLNDQEKRLL